MGWTVVDLKTEQGLTVMGEEPRDIYREALDDTWDEISPDLMQQVYEAFLLRGWIIPTSEAEVKTVEDYEAERFRECREGQARTIANHERYEDRERCHAAMSDGECSWSECPQLRDSEPMKTGRHCPIDTWVDDDY